MCWPRCARGESAFLVLCGCNGAVGWRVPGWAAGNEALSCCRLLRHRGRAPPTDSRVEEENEHELRELVAERCIPMIPRCRAGFAVVSTAPDFCRAGIASVYSSGGGRSFRVCVTMWSGYMVRALSVRRTPHENDCNNILWIEMGDQRASE